MCSSWVEMGYVMVCLLYSVDWYSVKYQTGSELILDVSSLKAVLVASASWSSQLTGECLVLLENGLGCEVCLEAWGYYPCSVFCYHQNLWDLL